MIMNSDLRLYNTLLHDIKQRVRQGQLRANLKANAEMLAAYWDIDRMIHERQQFEGWGAGVIPRLANDLKNELSEMKGFSVRNIQFMIQFYLEYSTEIEITKLPVSQFGEYENQITKLPVSQLNEIINTIEELPDTQLKSTDIHSNLILSTGWAHHIILFQKVKDLHIRYWYMQQCISNGWSRDSLVEMIKTKLHQRQGSATTNFDLTLPTLQSALAKEMLKDPYIFDYELTRMLPNNLKSSLPSIEDIETELSERLKINA